MRRGDGSELGAGQPRSEAEEAAEAYRSELRFLDEHLAALEKSWAWEDNTLVLVVSDHGEEFGEHGGIGHPFHMHAELNRVVLMARGPGVQAGRRATPVGLHDVLPTLLDWLQLAPPVETSGSKLGAPADGTACGRVRRPDAVCAPAEKQVQTLGCMGGEPGGLAHDP